MSQPAFAFQRVAIVNRGESAMRLINAVREWNAEGRPALRVIAVYTAADRRATFVREADEAVLIGPNPKSGADAAFAGSPYLDYAELERPLRACRADAVWPGWWFVSEKAEFAELCDRLGITFIGPPAEVMRRLGDKIESKLLAEQAGVPLAPWSGGPVADLAAARAQAESIGHRLLSFLEVNTRLQVEHPERRGPVLGARPVRRGRRAARALRAHVRFCGRAFPRPAPTADPADRGHLRVAARRPGLRRARRDLRCGEP